MLCWVCNFKSDSLGRAVPDHPHPRARTWWWGFCVILTPLWSLGQVLPAGVRYWWELVTTGPSHPVIEAPQSNICVWILLQMSPWEIAMILSQGALWLSPVIAGPLVSLRDLSGHSCFDWWTSPGFHGMRMALQRGRKGCKCSTNACLHSWSHLRFWWMRKIEDKKNQCEMDPLEFFTYWIVQTTLEWLRVKTYF